MKTLNFTDRLTYLAWRKEWKAAYAQLSVDIPRLKNEFKTNQRKIEYVKMDADKPWGWIRPYIDGKQLGSVNYYNSVWTLAQARSDANEMLELLKLAKKKSGEQRAAMIESMLPKEV